MKTLLVLAALVPGPPALSKALTPTQVRFSGAVEGSVPRHPVPGRARGLGRGPVGVTVGGAPIRRGPVPAGDRLLGYLRDGFRLYSVKGEPELDRCHGRFVRIRGRRAYQYVATPSSPFVARCFRAPPRRFRFPATASPPVVAPVPAPTPSASPIPDVPGVTPPLDEPGVTDHVTRECDAAQEPGFTLTIDGADHHVRCLPEDFGEWTVTRNGRAAAELYLLAPSLRSPASYLVAADENLTPVWWRKLDTRAADLKDLADGSLAWWQPFAYSVARPDGSPVRTWTTTGTPTDSHDFVPLPNGNALLLAYPPREHVDVTAYGHGADERVIEGEVQEVTPAGEVVWSWNSLGPIGLDETGRWWPDAPATLPSGLGALDRFHVNSVEPAPGGIIVSARHTDAIYKIDRATGDVVWKLGGTPTPQSLSGDAFFGGQHDARLLPDGTLTLFDNGTGLGRPPRALRYAIDEAAMTATLLEDVRDPAVTHSECCGSARRLPGGNWLVSWGGFDGNVSELKPDGTPVWRLRTGPGFTYRTVPAQHLTVADLRRHFP